MLQLSLLTKKKECQLTSTTESSEEVAMSNLAIETEQPAKPRLRQRLRSWKWWVYGDMNSKPLEKPPKGFRFQLFIGILFWLFIAVHPCISTWINRHPPKFSDLQVAHGIVISTNEKNPHLRIRLDNGEVLAMEYPSFMNNYGRTSAGPKKLGANNANVLGCRATVWFDIPRYTLWKRYRVWQIHCDDRDVSASYEEIIFDSEGMGLVFFGITAFILMPFLMALWFVRFMRGYYER